MKTRIVTTSSLIASAVLVAITGAQAAAPDPQRPGGNTRPSATAVSTNLIQEQQRPAASNPTAPLTSLTQGQIDIYEQQCLDLAQQAISEGREPINCTEQDPSFVPPADQGNADSTTGSGDDDGAGSAEDVLLIHGFAINSGHDCDFYWNTQKQAIESASDRNARIIGYYKHNSNCEDEETLAIAAGVNINTPLSLIANHLYLWILDNYSANGDSVDIVAHSMGGIIVRRMLQDYGHSLLVSDVITLGTPHDGVQTFLLNGSCAAIGQCREMAAGSAFMTSLEENPQSVIPTKWTLVAAADDQVVGYGTGTGMGDGNNGGPAVTTIDYDWRHKHDCGDRTAIGHGDLHGTNAAIPVYGCSNSNSGAGIPVPNPHDHILEAVGL